MIYNTWTDDMSLIQY